MIEAHDSECLALCRDDPDACTCHAAADLKRLVEAAERSAINFHVEAKHAGYFMKCYLTECLAAKRRLAPFTKEEKP